MKKIAIYLFSLLLIASNLTNVAYAAGGIYASGGKSVTAGQNFTVYVAASGATFDSLQGIISISGPVDVISFSPGGATWLPGKTPSNGGQFVGIVTERSSLTVATITLRGRQAGSGSVSVSGVRLAHKGAVTGTGAGATNFTITRALVPPSAVSVTSSSHPNPEELYEETNISLAWNKVAGVTGFSYLLDQVENTTPPAKATGSETSVTYENKEVGTYYFHIRAQNADGWGATTHFKINIKEPDPKVNEALDKARITKVYKGEEFINDVKKGTLSGIVIEGKVEPNFIANIQLSPTPVVPEEIAAVEEAPSTETTTETTEASENEAEEEDLGPYSVKADSEGNFQIILDFPIPAGFYTLTVQGQDDKILTPLSDETRFEISLARGGRITIITDSDKFEPTIGNVNISWQEKINWFIVSAVLLFILLAFGAFVLIKTIKKRRLL